MVRLLSQHGLGLPSSDLLQEASGIQTGSSVSMPDGLKTDIPAMSSNEPFWDPESAEVLPRCHTSQDDPEVSCRTSSL